MSFSVIIAVALVAMGVSARYPSFPLFLLVVGSGLALPLRQAGWSLSSSMFIASLAAGAGAVARILRARQVEPGMLVGAGLLAAGGGAAVAIGTGQSIYQSAEGVRLLLLPVVAAVLGRSLRPRSLTLVLKTAICIVLASALAAAYQSSISVAELAESGFEGGTSLRTINGVLRAPGLFMTNYDLGSFAAVLASLCVLGVGFDGKSQRDLLWRVLGLGASLGCLLLSVYRTGMVVLGLTLVLQVLFGRWRGRARVAAIIGALGAWAFLEGGPTADSASWTARLGLWAELLGSGRIGLVGNGVGSAGAASYLGGVDLRVVTDNSYISLAYQLGVFALPLVLALWGAAGKGALAARGESSLASRVMVSVLVAMFFVEFWEYSTAMCLAITAFFWASRSEVQGQEPVPQRAGSSPPMVTSHGARRLGRGARAGGPSASRNNRRLVGVRPGARGESVWRSVSELK